MIQKKMLMEEKIPSKTGQMIKLSINLRRDMSL